MHCISDLFLKSPFRFHYIYFLNYKTTNTQEGLSQQILNNHKYILHWRNSHLTCSPYLVQTSYFSQIIMRFRFRFAPKNARYPSEIVICKSPRVNGLNRNALREKLSAAQFTVKWTFWFEQLICDLTFKAWLALHKYCARVWLMILKRWWCVEDLSCLEMCEQKNELVSNASQALCPINQSRYNRIYQSFSIPSYLLLHFCYREFKLVGGKRKIKVSCSYLSLINK